MGVFSQRHAPAPSQYRYDIPGEVRHRILHTLKHCLDQHSQHMSLASVLEEIEPKLLAQYGGLRRSPYEAARTSDHAVIEHFFSCNEEQALDFIELCFQTHWNCGGQPTVEALNRVLEEASIGYELTPYLEIPTKEPARIFGRIMHGTQSYRIQPPHFIRKDEKLLHQEIIRPSLHVLSDPRFATASSEMIKAFEDSRKGRYTDAITSCGSAFESVLKTICDEKGWPYDPQRDTCSKLVDICKDHGLFPAFYKSVFEGTGTIRNKLGDVHGRGPAPPQPVGKEHVEHMLHTTCSHILLLVSLAKL